MSSKTQATPQRPAVIAALLVILAFALGFAEFVLIGITPDVANGLGEPLTLIGDLVGFYALACAIATPVVSLATAQINRFTLMLGLLVIFNIGNALAPFATSYPILLVSRMMAAATSGTLLALALTYIPEIIAKENVARVIALVLAGFSVAGVVSMPIGAALASAFSWEAAYGVVLVIGLITSVALLASLPRATTSKVEQATLGDQLKLLIDSRIILTIFMIVAGAASTYVFYTYVTPILQEVMGLDRAFTGIFLFVFGGACVLSNLASGWVAKRYGMRAMPLLFVLHAALLALLSYSIPQGSLGLVNMLCLGLSMYVMNSTVQLLFQNVARADHPSAVTLSASLHPMAFNAGIALGSFAGGAVVNTMGLTATGPAGAFLALIAAGISIILWNIVAKRKNADEGRVSSAA